MQRVLVAAGTGGRERIDELSRTVDVDPRAQLPIAPAQTEVRGPWHEAGHFAGLARGRSGTKITVRIENRRIGRNPQTLQQSREKGELLLIGQLPALHDGRAQVVAGQNGEAAILAVVAVVGTTTHRAGQDAVHEVIFDRLVKPADREAAHRFEIILQRGIPAFRRLRLQTRIVDRKRLRGLIDGFVREQIG